MLIPNYDPATLPDELYEAYEDKENLIQANLKYMAFSQHLIFVLALLCPQRDALSLTFFGSVYFYNAWYIYAYKKRSDRDLHELAKRIWEK